VFGVPGFKFGKYHHFEERWDADDFDREPRYEDEKLLSEFAARHFPSGCGPTMALQSCLFTNSPDNHFIIDLHPEYPQVSFASPCSGHGFKFASVIGEVMADLAERQETRHNIELFRLDRLQGSGISTSHTRMRSHRDLRMRESLRSHGRSTERRADGRRDSLELLRDHWVSTVPEEQRDAVTSFW
jgi:glycine/D-amino acid oxidase-like deaminating enzyme